MPCPKTWLKNSASYKINNSHLSVRLVKIGESEKDLIADLADKIWHAYYIEIITRDQIKYMLDRFYSGDSLSIQMSEGQEFYRVDEGENTHGFVSVSQKNQQEFFIHKFYILPQLHRKNIGSAVMQLILEDMQTRSQGMDFNVRLTVNRKNYKAINFYFKNGFTIEKVEDFDIGNGYFMNDFVMMLSIRH
jgi:ribosomal protein S18 acetylase RimI-like enzyme